MTSWTKVSDNKCQTTEGVAVSACNFNKKETLAQVFSCQFWKISKKKFFIELPRATASVAIL